MAKRHREGKYRKRKRLRSGVRARERTRISKYRCGGKKKKKTETRRGMHRRDDSRARNGSRSKMRKCENAKLRLEGRTERSVFALTNVDDLSGRIFLHVILFFGFHSRLVAASCERALRELHPDTCDCARTREKISTHSWRDAIENLHAKDISFLLISLTIRLYQVRIFDS